ncbi:MAG: response regulator, partial [Ruminococcaceae bacterium]|nr:response regulator [Oscillospiraceae bacterium]
MNNKRKVGRSAVLNMIVTALIIVLFVGVIFIYYAMLYSQTRAKIIKSGELSALASAEQIDKYLSAGVDTIRLAGYALDNMIRDGRTQQDIKDYLINQSIAVSNITAGNSTGLYGYINDEYLDGTGWTPDPDYEPTLRPWYISARARIGNVAVVDPYVDLDSNTVMIALAKTLCDAKSVVAMDFSMERLQAITEELAAEGESDMEIIMDRNYQVIAHTDKKEVGKDYLAESGTLGALLTEKLRTSDERFFSVKYNGAEYIVYATTVANDWFCLSLIDATPIFTQLRAPLIFTIAAALGIMAILLAIMIHSGRKSRIAEQLNETTERAIAASEAKSAFLSNMSHEIRTPINAVLGMNEMILRESEDPNVLAYSEGIRTAGNTLLGLVNDILDFSKIEAGRMEILPSDYDLSSVINDLVTMIQTRADAKGLLLALDFDGNTPRLLNGDEVRIKQVVTNILTNAVKYTEKGSVTFRIGSERIPDDPEGIYLDVSVRDTGIGIKPEDMSKLFSEFERIEEKRNRTIEGTGLGMTITKRLLEMMGSRLEVESTYGVGSNFHFRLKQKVVKWEPLGDYEATYRASLAARQKDRERFTAPDACVLMVDDTAMNLMVFKGLLKRTGVQVDTAVSGDEGLSLAGKKKYDMIFLDHMMPEKDGIETLHELRAQLGNPNLKTPLICLTANAISGAREKYLAEGFDDYLTKPIDAAKLEEMLMRYLPKEKLLAAESGGEEKQSAEPFAAEIDGIDAAAGMENCGGADTFRGALELFYRSVGAKADEIESLWRGGDLKNYTVKVHALKSSARTIGASELSERAKAMEEAGNAGDAARIDEKTP